MSEADSLNACDLLIVGAAPAVMTPGKVQPGIGKGRSCAPVAIRTRRVSMTQVLRSACVSPTVKEPVLSISIMKTVVCAL